MMKRLATSVASGLATARSHKIEKIYHHLKVHDNRYQFNIENLNLQLARTMRVLMLSQHQIWESNHTISVHIGFLFVIKGNSISKPLQLFNLDSCRLVVDNNLAS